MGEMKTSRIGGKYFLFILIAVTVVFFAMLRPFLISILLAAITAGLLYPVYTWMGRRVWDQPAFCSILCVVLVLLLIIIPVVSVLGLFTVQALQFKNSAESKLTELVEKAPGWFKQVQNHRLIKKIPLEEIDWQSKAADAAKRASTLLIKATSRTSQSAIQTLAMLFIMLYTMFYFLIDGPALLDRIKYLSPMKDEYEDQIIQKFLSMTRAIVKGTILIGVIQGAMGGIAFALFGVGSPVFWGTVMVILSIIPGIGSALVWAPAIVIKAVTGNFGQAAGILVFGVLISVSDNLLRPRLIGRDTKMHELMILFSTLGGIVLFGIVGFILGPILAAVFMTVIEIYGSEYREELEGLEEPQAPSSTG